MAPRRARLALLLALALGLPACAGDNSPADSSGPDASSVAEGGRGGNYIRLLDLPYEPLPICPNQRSPW